MFPKSIVFNKLGDFNLACMVNVMVSLFLEFYAWNYITFVGYCSHIYSEKLTLLFDRIVLLCLLWRIWIWSYLRSSISLKMRFLWRFLDITNKKWCSFMVNIMKSLFMQFLLQLSMEALNFNSPFNQYKRKIDSLFLSDLIVIVCVTNIELKENCYGWLYMLNVVA